MSLPHWDEFEPPVDESMREAGRIAAATLEYLRDLVTPGINTVELNRLADEFIREHGAQPAFHDHEDSSRAITVSVNEELLHSPPEPATELETGDLVSIDLGVKYATHYADTALTLIVGDSGSATGEKLVNQAKTAMYAGILQATAGNTLKDIGRAIEAESREYGNVTDWAGHFIGRALHLAPQVHNTAGQNESYQLVRGMYLTIEPVLMLSESGTTIRRANGAIQAADRVSGAHFEHTIRVGKNRAEIITARTEERDYL